MSRMRCVRCGKVYDTVQNYEPGQSYVCDDCTFGRNKPGYGATSGGTITIPPFTGRKKKVYRDGNKYNGDFVEDKRQGKGTYIRVTDKATYSGEWYNNVRHGYGVEEIPSKDGTQRYEGEWKEDKRCGFGKILYANGDRYEGEWLDNLRHGQGKFYYTNGNFYEGEWLDDLKHGQGKFYYTNGNFYEGGWLSNKKEGVGTYIFANGTRYDGELKNDKINGRGICHYADGEVYEGKWLDGKWHGKGKRSLQDGTVQDGYFENGKFVGTNAPVDRADDGEMDISPETFAQFVASLNIPPAQATPKAEPPKLVEESFEGLSDQEIWDRLLTMSADEKKAYFKAHHELTIPKGTEGIPANCFRLCFGLKKINFNEELREIGERAFTGASIDSVLVIPKSVENIGKHAFDMCRSIEKLVLPNNITLADYAFGFTNALAEVEFETEPPQGVVLGTGVFAHCDKHAMTSKEMIKKIKALNKKAFK